LVDEGLWLHPGAEDSALLDVSSERHAPPISVALNVAAMFQVAEASNRLNVVTEMEMVH